MNSKIIFALLVVVAAVAADERPSYSYQAPESNESSGSSSEEGSSGSSSDEGSYEYSSGESSEAKYNFEWDVEDDSSENDFEHQETRDGENTQGSYSVQLPDGRLQTVTYYVDGDNGYVAEVTYEGEAHYPEASGSYESSGSSESGSYESSGSSESGSYEAPRYTPPRPSYSAPESAEASFEAPVYRPPQSRYGAPDSNESK